MKYLTQEEFKAILERLKDNDQELTKLNLIGKELDDANAEELSNAIEGNNTLKSLIFCHNNISDVGAKKLINALEKNHTITDIQLFGNPISSGFSDKIFELVHFYNIKIKNEKDPIKKANLIGKKTNSFNYPSLLDITKFWIAKNANSPKQLQEQEEKLPKNLIDDIAKLSF